MTRGQETCTVRQAAERLGMGKSALYDAIAQDKFSPAIRIGGRIRVSVPQLDALIHGKAS